MIDIPKKRKATSGTRHGNGPSWGGERKGSGNASAPHKAFVTGNKVAAGPHDMSRSERVAALQDNLYDLAFHAENEATRERASNSLLNRLDGMPIARNINVNADDLSALSDADIADELARLSGEGIEATTGGKKPPRKTRPDGLVH